MKKYITFGKYNKNYKYIISSIIFKFFNNLFYGVQIGYYTEPLRLLPENDLTAHTLIHDIFNYFGIFIISLILILLDKIYTKKEEEEEKNDEDPDAKKIPRISLIYTQTNFDFIDRNIFLKILIICSIWILHEQSEKIFYFYDFLDLDYWPCEMLILAIIINKMFGIKIFRHQKFAIIFILVLGIFLKFSSFFISLKINDQNILFIRKKFWIPLGILIFLFIIILRSYINCKLKYLTDYKYISIPKILMIYGFSGTLICSIICVISTFIICNSEKCTIYNNDYSQSYYENFFIYFEKMRNFSGLEKTVEILYIILSALLNFFLNLSNLLIIKYLTPIHTICSGAIYYIIMQLVLLTVNKIKNDNFFIGNENKTEKAGKYVLDLFNDIFSFFSSTIYLELIEFNFCGCDYNLRKYIIERSQLEGKNIYKSGNSAINKGDNLHYISTLRSSDYSSSREDSIGNELSILPSND